MQKNDSETKVIRRILVDSLFGLYTYDILIPKAKDTSKPEVLILYGDNGSGKTTIMRLIYSLLLPGGGGRKTYIANTPFQNFKVEFANGITISAEKKPGGLIGSFTQIISEKGKILNSFSYETTSDGSIAPSPVKGEVEFNRALRALDINLNYLPDDRKLQADSEEESRLLFSETLFHPGRKISAERAPSQLEKAAQSALEWARKQLITASRVGEDSTNTIYRTLIQKLAKSGKRRVSPQGESGKQLADRLIKLAEANNEFAKMGLTSQVDINEIVRALRTGKTENVGAVCQVAGLYANGMAARLSALQQFKNLLYTFLQNVNSFFTDKHMDFNLKEGFLIQNRATQPLQLNKLSSGEKQLLLLLFDTLASSDRANIFVIDEPEISLNIKWQRNLVAALRSCLPHADSQFIFATHSIQILTGFKEYTVQLRSK